MTCSQLSRTRKADDPRERRGDRAEILRLYEDTQRSSHSTGNKRRVSDRAKVYEVHSLPNASSRA